MHINKNPFLSYSLKLSLFLFGITVFSFLSLISTNSFAEDSITSDVAISVPVSCSFTDDTTPGVHAATINPGTYEDEIGYTNFKVFCNDSGGFALYAIGYSNEEYGNTTLIGSGTGQTIATGIAESGNTSNWAMKLIKDTNGYQPNNLVIESAPNVSGEAAAPFFNYHTVPDTYTKVATYNASTDATIGAKLQSTYAVYISSDQMADTYVGKVRYTLVHPATANAPEDPRFITKLGTGTNVNQKLKALAGATSPSYGTQDNTITALKRANALPSGFTPSTANTISASDSTLPIYAWYDSNDTTIYYYSEANRIYMNENSNSFFYEMRAISDFSTIATWDTSNVTNMSYMFYNAGRNATTFRLDLSSWNTASVTDMGGMFSSAGYKATTWSVGDLSSWNTAKVTNMSYMFNSAGPSATTFNLDLSSWNTAKVTNMSYMFYYAGPNATTWSVGDLSGWNTASVTTMSSMFYSAGHSAATWSVGDLSSWNTSSVTNMQRMFQSAGYKATTWSVGDLSSWNTTSVTNMGGMFSHAGYSSDTWSVGNLSSWNTASVTNMQSMFSSTGRNATTWSVGDLSSWNTTSVTDMSRMFYNAGYSATTFSLDLSSWNTASVTNMASMFSGAGYSSGTWSVGDLSSWNTTKVTDMSNMFNSAGHSATTFTLDLSSWNTASVTSMSYMFYYAGYRATTFTLDLSSWNTASVTSMSNMFSYAGHSATTFSLDLSSWSTASVTNMSYMFSNVGYRATTWSVKIPKTNGAATPINNTTSNLYGNSTSVTATPPSGKSFTLAN